MTPTRAQLDAALEHAHHGIPAMAGDLTHPDARAEALAWLEDFYARAFGPRLPEPDPELEALLDEERTISEDDWQGFVRFKTNGVMVRQHWDDIPEPLRAKFRREAPWPPPAKGTHESDLFVSGHFDCRGYLLPGSSWRGGVAEFRAARDWSRSA